MHYLMIVHNDLDGTCSAAVYSRIVGNMPRKIIFVPGPDSLVKVLGNIRNGKENAIVIADLGMNSSIYSKVVSLLRELKSMNKVIEWYDHHVWEEEWIREVKGIGVDLHVDNSTCGAGVIEKYKGNGDNINKVIVDADCSVDLWMHNNSLGEKLRRVIELNRDFKWKMEVVEELYKGNLWNKKFEESLIYMIKEELKGYSNILKNVKVIEFNGVKLAFSIKWNGPPDISYGAQYVMSRTGSEVFCSYNGSRVSFRSNRYNVREIAHKLGGGGHVLAAGAKIQAPLYLRVLRKMGIKKPMLDWISRKVLSVLNDIGRLKKVREVGGIEGNKA